nr:hypothetical protein [Streptomyces europaeiscabiei]
MEPAEREDHVGMLVGLPRLSAAKAREHRSGIVRVVGRTVLT